MSEQRESGSVLGCVFIGLALVCLAIVFVGGALILAKIISG